MRPIISTDSDSAQDLITTPGATRFYRSVDELALQRTNSHLADQARLEWLPLETIAYNHCVAERSSHGAQSAGTFDRTRC